MLGFPLSSRHRHYARTVLAIVVLSAFLLLGINVYVQIKSKDFIIPAPAQIEKPIIDLTEDQPPVSQVAILLGASVYGDGELTPTLKDRVDTAIYLYKTGLVRRILVSGDGSRPEYDEITPIHDYLMSKGVPEESLTLDRFGVDTYDSMYRAKNVHKVESALVVSQRFHLSRAVFIARDLGIGAYGVSADRQRYGVKSDIRELFATPKSFFEVILSLKPEFES